MTENDNKDTNKEYCLFKGILGFDRILKQQSYPATQQDNTLYSLPFPQKDGKEACNIVILGEPGTGKSTLALEMAMGLRVGYKIPKKNSKNEKTTHAKQKDKDKILYKIQQKPATVIYFALEQDRDSLIKRAKEIDEDHQFFRAICEKGPQNPIENENLDNLYKNNLKSVYNIKTKTHPNLLLMPILSPRPLEQIGGSGEENFSEPSIFWKRLSEIRNMVEKLDKNDNKTNGEASLPRLRMVIIDSLNVFSNKSITRYLIDQLFSFFSDRGLIGVFIAEDYEPLNIENRKESNLPPGIVNLADVVIRTSWKKEEGYTFRNIEIVKSRNTANVYGPQQLKIRGTGIEIYPSLHSWYSYLHTTFDNSQIPNKHKRYEKELKKFFQSLLDDKDTIWNHLRIKNFRSIPSLVFLVAGPKEKGKSTLGLHFAATGVPPNISIKNAAEKYLIVNFDEPFSSVKDLVEEESFNYKIKTRERDNPLKGILQRSKGHIERIELKRESEGKSYKGYELWLTPGYLLPEEFVYFLYQILRSQKDKPFTRVILRDVGELPMRHPILAKQILSGGSNYVPVLLELFKLFGVDCMFICTVDENDDSKAIERGLSTIAHFRIVTEDPENARDKKTIPSEESKDSVKTYWLMGRFVKEPTELVLKIKKIKPEN